MFLNRDGYIQLEVWLGLPIFRKRSTALLRRNKIVLRPSTPSQSPRQLTINAPPFKPPWRALAQRAAPCNSAA
jgi:hypothetical protein